MLSKKEKDDKISATDTVVMQMALLEHKKGQGLIMKKRLLCVLAASAVALSMMSCGANEAVVSSQAASEKKVVEIWTNDRHDLDYINKKIEEYNATNQDNIEIKQTVVTDDYFNMLTMAKTSGTAPDIATLNGGAAQFDLKTFVDSGIIRPLNEFLDKASESYVENTDYKNHVYEGINAIGEDIYWVPTGQRSGTRILYNKTLFEKAGITEFPKTLSEMVDAAKTITEQGEGKYYGYATTVNAPIARCLEGIAEKSGQNLYGYDYVNGKFDFSGYKPIIEEFQKMFTDGSVLPGSASQQVDAMRAQFAAGNVAMWPNASQEAGVFTNQFPIDTFEWGVAELPTLDGEIHGAQTAQPQKGYIMMADTDVPQEAWKVIEYFASEEFLKEYYESGFSLPISEHMSNIIDSTKSGRIQDFGRYNYESVYPLPPSVTVQGEDSKTVLWSATMGERDIDEAIEDLNKRYNEALERDLKMGKVKRVVVKDFDPLHPADGTVEYLDK